MIRIYTIAALVAALSVTGWLLKKEVALNAHLGQQNAQLQIDLEQAASINQGLVEQVNALLNDRQKLQRSLLESEQRKTTIAQENARLRDEIDRGISDAPNWASQPIPGRVLGGVRDSIAGLYAEKAPDNH